MWNLSVPALRPGSPSCWQPDPGSCATTAMAWPIETEAEARGFSLSLLHAYFLLPK